MKQSWTNGLDADMKKEIKMAFKSSLVLRKRLALLLRKKEDENYAKDISVADYDSPNWTHKKADAIGYARALRDIIDLIEEK